MPNEWEHINWYTHMSLMMVERPDFIYLETPRGGDIAEKREGQVEEGLKRGCTDILLCDSDMVYPPTTIQDLIAMTRFPTKTNEGRFIKADMAAGLTWRGYPPWSPVLWKKSEKGILKKEEELMTPFTDFQFGQFVEAGATGAACLLVKSHVFKGVERPWFRIQKEERVKDGINVVIRRGEDTYFTRRAVHRGFTLLVNTLYDISHMRYFQINREFWLMFTVLAALEDWEMVGRLLQKVMDKKWRKRHLGPIKPKKNI
jgi:hypothetical protein